MDYYSTLGVSRNSSPEDIKKAYRKLAMRYHPDRNNGDDRKFKDIQRAYEVLSDPQKRKMFDMGADPTQQHSGNFRQGPFEFHFDTGNMEDLFNFGFGRGRPRQPVNRTVSLNLQITLEDCFFGKNLDAQVSLPSGSKIINISIPPGIGHGQTIKYSGIGDQSIPNALPGDIIVNIMVQKHPKFTRQNDNLVYNHSISVWDAITGVSPVIETLDKKLLNINIPAGTQPETTMNCKGYGMPNVRSGVRGNLYVKVKVDIPRNLTEEQMKKVREIKNGV